jgi:SNF2 family DNA or RNA helicase
MPREFLFRPLPGAGAAKHRIFRGKPFYTHSQLTQREHKGVGVNEGNRGEKQDAADAEAAFLQPALVTGARLRDYQLEGLQWMVGLHEQGISRDIGAS